MSEETKKQAANTEISDEDLTGVAGTGPHVKVFDGQTGAQSSARTNVEYTLTVTDTQTG